MKRLILTMVIAASCITYSNAQLAEKGTTIVSISTGRAIALGASPRSVDSTMKVNQTNRRVLAIGLDHHVSDVFTIGAVLANQVIDIGITDSITGNPIENGNVNRLYFGFRGRWNYGRGDVVRFYSGLRVGAVYFTSFNVERQIPGESIIEDSDRMRYSLGLTPIGINVFLMENLALHLETNFGAPGILFFGGNFRF